jgi:large subunit ribosomal protein L10
MARSDKVEKVKSLAEVFQEARSIVLNDFTGLDVEKLSELRKRCRSNSVGYRVVKNTLAKRSISGTQAEDLGEYFEGPTAIAFSNESENIAAKILAQFSEEHEAPRFKAALVEGKLLEEAEVIELSKLPSRAVLLATALADIKAPASKFVYVCQGTLRKMLYALNAIVEKRGSEKQSQ